MRHDERKTIWNILDRHLVKTENNSYNSGINTALKEISAARQAAENDKSKFTTTTDALDNLTAQLRGCRRK